MKRGLVTFGLFSSLVIGATPAMCPQGGVEQRYEMTTYYLVLLYRGPKSTGVVTPETQRIQEEHMANIRRMAESGKLILAGPISDNGNLRGIFVFRIASLEEAKALADADPAVKAGRLVPEIHPWFSAKNIRVYTTSEEAAMGTSSSGEDTRAVEQEINALERRRFHAMLNADTAALEPVLADDLIYTHSSGRADTKAQFIGALKAGELKYLSISTDDAKVLVHGSAAVVTGRAVVKVDSKGQELNMQLRYTDTWVKRNGHWQMVVWESTRIASP